MKTLDILGDRHRAEPLWSAESSGTDDRHAYPMGARKPDLEIRAYYRGQQRRISLADVIYLSADQKYVCVHHRDGVLLVDHSLCAFEHDFPELLLRIHRNALVMRARLIGVERQPDGSTRALLSGCDDRPIVSRRHLRAVRDWLRQRANPGQ
ncbi:LytTR family DNA-binding domain-containing protein [Thermochromatium tepidum]|nr:LytTR family DNA-binding domain-containing protein [Thermochromatium tepidum]